MKKTNEVADIPFLFDCASSKLKVSRDWNVQLLKLGRDINRFSCTWRMSSVPQSNAKGTWVNIDIENVGWLKKEAYDKVESFYNNTFVNKS